ncbi:MAG: type II toxin-antitoxin system HicA family toxin [Chitinophagaceae bacterium]
MLCVRCCLSPKTPAYTSKEIIRLPEQNGFVFDRPSGSHQIYILPDGSKRVIVPLHNKDLPKGNLHSILKQAGIDKKKLQTSL